MAFPRIRKLKIYFLKKEIEKNPLIGIREPDGDYLYKKNGYTLRYRIAELPSRGKRVQLISYKSRLSRPEESIYKIKRFFQRLVFYPRIKPSIIFSFFLIIIITYIWILIPESKKAGFYKSVLSRAIGVSSEQIEYIGGGWFEIYGKRIIPEDKHTEPLTFTFNPFRWLFLSDAGSVTRWQGKESGGYVTHHLEVGPGNRVSVGQGKSGKIEGDKVEWNLPRGVKPSITQDIEIEKEGIRIIDR